MVRRLVVVLVVLVAVGAVGCGGEGLTASEDERAPMPSTSSTTTTRPVCAASLPTVPTRETMATAEGERRYLVAGPPATIRPVGIIFDFHGTGSTAEQEAAYTRLSVRGTERGYVVVTPQGERNPARWTVPGIPGPDDVTFVEELTRALSERYCLGDLPRFATGISAGAAMSVQLACRSEFGAIAPVAGVGLYRRCPDGAPVSVLAFHGTADAIVPYGGRPDWERADANPRAFALLPVEVAMASFADRAGCDPEPTEQRIAADALRRTWTGCEDGIRVELVVLEGGGHTIPGIELPAAIGERLGPVSMSVDAVGEALDLFDSTRSVR
jgi:polyhydroxybutyrate depolymerase